MDDDMGLGLPEDTPAPEGTPEPTPEPAPEPDYVEIKNRDEVWDVDRAAFEAVAKALGKDVDDLRTAVQMGLDGSKAYQRVNEERDQLRAAWQELAQIKAESMRAPATRPAGPAYSQDQPPMARPPAQDVTGNVIWMADRIDRLGQLIDRIPALETALTETREAVQEREEQQQVSEERVYALQAYQDTAEQWKKNGWGELPSYERCQQFLRRIPLSDDTEMSWHDIWDSAGWAIGGKDVARRQRRQAVIDNTKPGAVIRTPINQASGASQRSNVSMSATGEMSEDEMKSAEQALQGMTLAEVVGGQRRMGS